jgi:ribosomal protein L11 methyltransferase
MIELTLVVPQDLVESLSDSLINELDALSVSVEDADADSEDEQPLFGEPGMPTSNEAWCRSVLKALFSTEEHATCAASLILAQLPDGRVQVQAMNEVVDQDWVRLTQMQFTPVDITPDFWVVPSWCEPPKAARRILRLDPGLAFGTGTHPTTRMCLRWVANQAGELSQSGSRVLDYGCGSGILAIGAALSGAQKIDAVDIDPAAVESTLDNARINGVSLQAGQPDIVQGCYGLVLANILATPLKLLAPLLCQYLAPGGSLVLAGILERQAQELKAAYQPWLDLEVTDQQEGWILMTAKRSA